MKDIVLFGIQGSGKGTQARILAEQHGYKVFETGKELRRLAQEDSELGREVKETIEGGNLVSDELVIEIVKDFLGNVSDDEHVIFDGLPRKEGQRGMLEEILVEMGRSPLGVMIHIDDELAVTRLSSRWMSQSTGKIYSSREAAVEDVGEEDAYQRADDTPDAIRTRLAAYHAETQPVIDWYRGEGRLVEVDGNQGLELVTEGLLGLIGGSE
jgi:adenylate kinase